MHQFIQNGTKVRKRILLFVLKHSSIFFLFLIAVQREKVFHFTSKQEIDTTNLNIFTPRSQKKEKNT
jgi:hypothetical protein